MQKIVLTVLWSSAGCTRAQFRSSAASHTLHTLDIFRALFSASQLYFTPIHSLCSADAKFNIGAMMLGGFGVAKDYGQALVMFSHAANMVDEAFVLPFYIDSFLLRAIFTLCSTWP